MATSITYPNLSGKNLLDPGEALIWARHNDSPIDFLNRANSYTCHRGPNAGVAWVLMTRREFDKLGKNTYQTLTWIDRTHGNLSIPNLAIVRAISMNLQARKNDLDSAYLVELQDVRRILRRESMSKSYNVRQPAPREFTTTGKVFYDESTDTGGAPWTWSTMLADMWSVLPPIAGTSPTLPYTPAGTPENMQFWGVSAWEAIHVVLDVLGCTTSFNPVTGVFTFVRTGEVQAEVAAELVKMKDRIQYDYAPVLDLNLANVPAFVEVFFPRKEVYYGTEKDTPRVGNWHMTPIATLTISTGIANASGTVPIWASDTPAMVKDDAIINNAELVVRATQLATTALPPRIVPQWDRARIHINGISTTILPGSDIGAVRWRDYGDWDNDSGQGGLVTEIHNGPDESLNLDADYYPAMECVQSIDLGRNTFPSYPHYKQLIQIVHPQSEAREKVTPACGKFFLGKVKRWTNSVMETLEDCWVLDADEYDLKAGQTELVNGQYYHGRLSGSETCDYDSYPVYTITPGSGSGGTILFKLIEDRSREVDENDKAFGKALAVIEDFAGNIGASKIGDTVMVFFGDRLWLGAVKHCEGVADYYGGSHEEGSQQGSQQGPQQGGDAVIAFPDWWPFPDEAPLPDDAPVPDDAPQQGDETGVAYASFIVKDCQELGPFYFSTKEDRNPDSVNEDILVSVVKVVGHANSVLHPALWLTGEKNNPLTVRFLNEQFPYAFKGAEGYAEFDVDYDNTSDNTTMRWYAVLCDQGSPINRVITGGFCPTDNPAIAHPSPCFYHPLGQAWPDDKITSAMNRLDLASNKSGIGLTAYVHGSREHVLINTEHEEVHVMLPPSVYGEACSPPQSLKISAMWCSEPKPLSGFDLDDAVTEISLDYIDTPTAGTGEGQACSDPKLRLRYKTRPFYFCGVESGYIDDEVTLEQLLVVTDVTDDGDCIVKTHIHAAIFNSCDEDESNVICTTDEQCDE